MGLKYVINSMKRRKLRTFIIAMALTIGVALVGALLALVDTQRQFSLQAIGAQTGGYDLGITQSDTASTPFFDIAPVEQLAREVYPQIAQLHPRIQANAEARKAGIRLGFVLRGEVDGLLPERGEAQGEGCQPPVTAHGRIVHG